MRERYLLRADRSGYAYREILELRPGVARLLVPSERSRRTTRFVSILAALAYIFLLGTPLGALIAGPLLFLGIPGLAAAAATIVAFFAGLFALEIWWDNRALLILAESPAQALPLAIEGIRSFGTFQEVRARAQEGEVLLTVHGRHEEVMEALRFAGLRPSA